MLIRFAGNGDPDAVPAQVGPNGSRAIAFVTPDAVRTLPGTSRSFSADRSSGHHLLEHLRLVVLAGGEHKGHRLTAALGAEVDFGTKTALTTPESFSGWVPFLAPAACWWARMIVLSTKWISQWS